MNGPSRILGSVPWAAHVLASGLDAASRSQARRSLSRAFAWLEAPMRHATAPRADDPPGTSPLTWPTFPVHGRGTYTCSVVVLSLRVETIRPMLPADFALGRDLDGEADSHPVLLFFGRQTDVRPNVLPLPGMNYREALVAIPGVFARDARYAYQGPFVYVPRLWLDKLPPVLIGLILYGYSKVPARIEESERDYTIGPPRGGAPLAEARFERAGAPIPPHATPTWRMIDALLHQPILAEPMPGVEIGSVLSFRTNRIRTIQPLRAAVRLAPDAVPGFAGGSFTAEGLARLPAAFRMVSDWELTPPLPRSWLRTTTAPVPDPVAGPEGGEGVFWAKPRKRRVAVLGGGVGALTAAWALTQTENWKDYYDITVYQMGWRLGGKGASGRSQEPDLGQRIEEHGLHVWAGFYENAFRVMRACYEALGRAPGAPLATLEDAFKPQRLVTLEDDAGGWSSWNITVPENGLRPGEDFPAVPDHPGAYIPGLIDGIIGLLSRAPAPVQAAGARSEAHHRPSTRLAVALAKAAGHGDQPGPHAALAAGQATSDAPRTALNDALAVARHAAARPGLQAVLQHRAVLRLVRAVHEDPALQGALGSSDAPLRRVVQLIDLAAATIRGMIADGLIYRGFTAVDGEEWRSWLRRHGADEGTLQSPTVRATYDYVFGFERGDTNRGALAAGTTTHGLLRLLLTYKGALFWTMQAGMGDTVFAPLYRVLRQRGVRFEFFHKVTHLGLSHGKRSVERIEVTRQATPAGEPYEPLIDVNGLACWPSCPRYDKLEQGDALKASGADLESDWCAWPGEARTLRRGADFDEVILGIPLGALPPICRELIDASPRWREMVRRVKTVPTLAAQLWLLPDLQGLGWNAGSTVATAYAEPFDTWADMSRLIGRERWPADRPGPGSIVYLCGPLEDGPGGPSPDPGFPGSQMEKVKATARTWLRANSRHLWPTVSNSQGGLCLSQLHDPRSGHGDARLEAQYFRANVSGSERYVQSVPGSTAHRLRAGESGFDNLYLAGDWVRTGLSAGCVESATMAGLAAAASLSGREIDIVDGSDAPLAASLAQHVLGFARGVAQTEAVVVAVDAPAEKVSRLLPPGLELAPSPFSAAGRAPLILLFARHRNARPNFLPLGVDYREFILLVPTVRLARSGADNSPPQTFAYMPRLYLDSVLMTLLGQLAYGYEKRLARIALERGAAAVRARGGDQHIVSVDFQTAGAPMPAPSALGFQELVWLLDRPILSRSVGGGWRTSCYDLGLREATMQGIDVRLTIGPALRPQFDRVAYTATRDEGGVIGAFRLWTESHLANPLVGLGSPMAAS